MTETTASWPPSPDQRALLAQLGELVRRFGAERFTAAALVRADEQDFPEPWEPTIAGVHRVLHRLLWHAYLDPDVIVEDARPSGAPDRRMLTTSEIELGAVGDGRVTFHVAAIGNDDVAGLLAHRIGTAFLELTPGDPFRTARTEASEGAGSTAAVYLGLGVLVANSAMYRRYASRLVGKEVFSEEKIATVGGLSIADATFLIAVQDVVRDDYQGALSTLHPAQSDWVARWTEILEDHEDELRAELGLDDAPAVAPLVRADAPRSAPQVAERDLTRFNHGKTTFRVPARSWTRALVGFAIGMGAMVVIAVVAGFIGPGPILGMVAIGALIVPPVIGRLTTRRSFMCADTQCRTAMATDSITTCPGCGGSIAETIAHANHRLDRLEELEGPPGEATGHLG